MRRRKLVPKIINDQVTEPKVTSEQLRSAIGIALELMEDAIVEGPDITEATKVLKEARRNRNWIMYVP